MSRNNRQQISVRFHPHALDRLKQRFPGIRKEWLRGRLRQRIPSELRKGAEVNKSGGLEIEVEPGMWAVCFPSLMGGWEVATIIREGWNGDMEERRRYGSTTSSGENEKLSREEYEETQTVLFNYARMILSIFYENVT